MASASGITPPVPFRVGATVACELTALHDNNELEVTPEDVGAFTSCMKAGNCSELTGVPCGDCRTECGTENELPV